MATMSLCSKPMEQRNIIAFTKHLTMEIQVPLGTTKLSK